MTTPTYEDAANTVVNDHGATLNDLPADQLAALVHSGGDLAEAAEVVLVHDYCTFPEDYAHFGL